MHQQNTAYYDKIKNRLNHASRIDSNFSWYLDLKKKHNPASSDILVDKPSAWHSWALRCPNFSCFGHLTGQFLSLLPQVPVRADPPITSPRGPRSSVSLSSSCRMLLSELFPAFPTLLASATGARSPGVPRICFAPQFLGGSECFCNS